MMFTFTQSGLNADAKLTVHIINNMWIMGHDPQGHRTGYSVEPADG